MFENITKCTPHASGKSVYDFGNCLAQCYGPDGHDNAEFIAYCFNLQHKYDISKYEEAITLLESLLNNDGIYYESDKESAINLLTSIKR